jgi:hypothetical protein
MHKQQPLETLLQISSPPVSTDTRSAPALRVETLPYQQTLPLSGTASSATVVPEFVALGFAAVPMNTVVILKTVVSAWPHKQFLCIGLLTPPRLFSLGDFQIQ